MVIGGVGLAVLTIAGVGLASGAGRMTNGNDTITFVGVCMGMTVEGMPGMDVGSTYELVN